jgi:hypothetical protein
MDTITADRALFHETSVVLLFEVRGKLHTPSGESSAPSLASQSKVASRDTSFERFCGQG